MNFPTFKYHADPIASGSVEKVKKKCICCDKDVEYIYMAKSYGPKRICEELCPWCISDGSAYRKFKTTFSKDDSLKKAGINTLTIEEVTQRTPGYVTWQKQEWASHCNDACVFIGDAQKQILEKLNRVERGKIFDVKEIDDKDWQEILKNYTPGDDPSIYHFKCLHCGENVFKYDCS